MPARENLFDQQLAESTLRLIGKGISFPFAFASSGRTSQVNLESGIRKINQSIQMILSTRPGERMMLPEYGSRLPDLVFEPLDDRLHILLNVWTAGALKRWEPRIEIVKITTFDPTMYAEANGANASIGNIPVPFSKYGVDVPKVPSMNPSTMFEDQNTVAIQIDYIIKQMHTPASFVYPFKLGGMPLSETVQNQKF